MLNRLNDVREDLGYLPKGQCTEAPKLSDREKERPRKIDCFLMGQEKRKKNLEVLKALDPSLEDEGQSVVAMVFEGKRIEFHLASDTWYSYRKNMFGYGIEKQVQKIRAWLDRLGKK